ncbi:MAG: PD40 domain-containing protein [Bacteroidaceae bacterium]|nr:PD40 domain-containing protein [Bacteroidaceae bacterium]
MKSILYIMMALALVACHSASVPKDYTKSDSLPGIYPDYIDVTIPVNIAPLTFMMDGEADEMVARLSCGDEELVIGGNKIKPKTGDWHNLLQQAQGKDITVEVFARHDGQWTGYRPFALHVSPDSIDPWLSYRLISPSYVAYEELTLNQRCLENYDERVMVDNMLCSTETEGQCVNCHSYQNYSPDRMLFHARQNMGGTIVAYDGNLRKINMRNDSILSAGVYPAWHPWLPLVVFSSNRTEQGFHTANHNKVEVIDDASDLIAYDVERNLVTNIENIPEEFETYPAWAPDGKTVYFCSAHFVYNDSVEHDADVIMRAKEFKYNIYKKSFDPETMTFGPRQLVFRADSLGMSATLPRISPDGRFLVFTLGNYGCFHIWHHEADLWMINLNEELTINNEKCFAAQRMDGINSDDTESYHSWSSNGRWMVVSSRREDGNYTRPFIAHIDEQGRSTKAFALPQADPEYHRLFMKCFNIPEFMRGPVKFSPQDFAKTLRNSEGQPAQYAPMLRR